MDRNEGIGLLKGSEQGVAEWNRRRKPGESIPNLRGADLCGANLIRANLIRANLIRANLIRADLYEAKLSRADLSEADLYEAKLRGAKLSTADLSDARCGGTTFGDVDLSAVKGLDSITHSEPSTVGIDTLFRSGGKLREAFLRGCGVPETLIVQLKSD
jgi:uncharacterized protein YjbI with pentapeptide repeats